MLYQLSKLFHACSSNNKLYQKKLFQILVNNRIRCLQIICALTEQGNINQMGYYNRVIIIINHFMIQNIEY